MYNSRMKILIEKAMNYGIKNINTYRGYDGADILKLTFHDNQELLEVRNFCKSREIDTTVKLLDELELYCIFEPEVDENIYALKDE